MPLVREVTVENYKSVKETTVELGRVNVLIGANGSGKSNVLEAIAYGSCAARGKVDNEYLAPRGIRVVEPRVLRSAFPKSASNSEVRITFQVAEQKPITFHGYPERPQEVGFLFTSIALNMVAKRGTSRQAEAIVRRELERQSPPDFLIYAPENSALRIFQSEPQILPLGVKGEGLFAHLKALGAQKRSKALVEITKHLALLDWFEKFEIPKNLAPGERSLLIRDRYLAEGALFDQRSANEGFLFILFYLTAFISDQTPSFFAIDNVDAGLNPRLVTSIVRTLVTLAKKHDKQVIFTTHNPAVLDGLDLSDDDQRLFVADRASDGSTKIRRVPRPKAIAGRPPVPLSEAFLRGYLGGLPKNF